MSVLEKINKKLLEEQEARKDRVRSHKISPSALGRCFRYQYWNRGGVTPTNPPDVRTLRIFKVGSLFHSFIQDFYPEAQKEVRVESEDILGFADLVTEDAVIDIKSQHSKAFWYMKQKNYDINVEKLPNILQVICYASLLNKEWGRLLFVSKDDLCVEEYAFSGFKWLETLEEELATLRDLWSKKSLPEAKPRAYKGKECRLCSFLDLCKEKEGKKHPYKAK